MKLACTAILAGSLLLPAARSSAAERPVQRMPLQERALHLGLPQPAPLQIDSTLACFEGLLSQILNPGCFDPGDCSSSSSHFMVQYIFPNVGVTHRVLGFGFLNNDAETVFPSGGIILIPRDNQGGYRWPTQSELQNLQVHDIVSATDTSVAFADLEAAGMTIDPGSNVALVVALQFPEGGTLQDVGVGPGIVCDGDLPDQDCDFFTLDGGVSDSSWLAPCGPNDGAAQGCPENPPADPLDWGFVVLLEPILGVESATWSHMKTLYRTP